ncbi:ABC transporter ATP-binding protein [Bacillaceae bacterium SIJ1]|uniref:ABC transporter ATP-binding protein n=1 Tax=Litoribacterium kuwaitense TaxID=1398745 RepID=UPI0013ECFEC2|nr:ABC transporter ATP-binding protein [Litoribacterium kuwaitense]NGP45145.1 ABC transporter ATP-binding protein [Litoribacterium kuwaitense]
MINQGRTYGMLDIIKVPFKCSPMMTTVLVLQTLLSGLIPTVQVVVTAAFINTAISIVQNNTDISQIYSPLFTVVALIGYQWISEQLKQVVTVKLENDVRVKFRTPITEKRAKLDYKHIENHHTWDLISRVSKDPEEQVKNAFANLLSIIAKILQVVGILGLLIVQVWWAALLILAISVPLFMVAIKSGKANYEANREVSKYKRKSDDLSDVLTGRDTVDERTLFGYGDTIRRKWHELYETARTIEFKTELKWFIKMKSGSLITAFISFIVILILLGPVLAGTLTIGMFISLVNAVFGLVQTMSWELTYNVDRLAKHREYFRDLTAFGALEETEDAIAAKEGVPPVFQSLEFRDVRFTYPGTDKKILDGVSFRLEAGKNYAFVGVNGAGKTTITKLLTGLYDDYEGDIYLNEKNITDYKQSELKSFFSIVYQDFAKYQMTLKENMLIGDTHKMSDVKTYERVGAAVEQLGLNRVVDRLTKRLDTPLGKIKAGGQDISGGEWQRVAMARAIVNPAPLRVLDEPTAALDPLSESDLYERFEEISRDKTTIFISHRLGSTKLADEIFVIGDGRMIEHGNHKALMQLGGIYAEMYESQRSWYQ